MLKTSERNSSMAVARGVGLELQQVNESGYQLAAMCVLKCILGIIATELVS